MIRLLQGDCRDVLKTLPDASVHCIVTSPPYFGLRDYGTGEWEGGEPGCDHRVWGHSPDKPTPGGRGGTMPKQEVVQRESCGKCGARRIDRQIGLEPTPDAYVAEMVAVMRECRRVLRNDGTLWLNIGDSYNNVGGGNAFNAPVGSKSYTQKQAHNGVQSAKKWVPGLKPKDLIGIPWLLAFALRADGWYLRSEIIWSKPNPMPESVRDRPTKAHEQIFLLTKRPSYFYDAEAVREEGTSISAGSDQRKMANDGQLASINAAKARMRQELAETGSISRNRRSVWTVATQPFSEAHFATFPPDLIEPCIKAGCPNGGTVLDPFGGAGTTGLVADRLQRNAILIELNPAYADMARKRLSKDAGMFAEVA